MALRLQDVTYSTSKFQVVQRKKRTLSLFQLHTLSYCFICHCKLSQENAIWGETYNFKTPVLNNTKLNVYLQ